VKTTINYSKGGTEMQTKNELRKMILEQRKKLSEEDVYELSEQICNKVKELQVYKEAEDICLYMPANNEVDVTFLIEDAWNAGKSVWLPKTSGRRMDFFKFDSTTPLSEGAYKILEPVSDVMLDPDEKTLVLMPGVAFSMEGGRIGYGKGYYDIYLEQHYLSKKIAGGYDFQIVDDLPIEEHDIKPDFIISEKITGKINKDNV
jgi:5-formyltetrahydrofolate cyclo-ligase